MDYSNYSQEIQNYIETIDAGREQGSVPDYDSCQRILEYAAESNSDALFGMGYYYFAEYYRDRQDAEQTMYCLAECTKCFRNAGMYEYLARAYNMMGDVSNSGDNRLAALSYYYTALQYAEKHHYLNVHAVADSGVAHILTLMKHYKRAGEHYHSAIECFEQSGDIESHVEDIVRCMMYCGFCHLLSEETAQALELRNRIHDILRTYPGSSYSKIALSIFETNCEAVGGDAKQAEDLEELMSEDEEITKLQDLIVIMADLLDRRKDYEQIEHLLALFEEKKTKENEVIYLDLYPFKSQCLLEKNKIEEYIDCTRQYLHLYQKHLWDSEALTARILELQDKLRRMEVKQRSIQESNRHLETIALYDSMTNLANRTYLNEYLSQQFEEAYEQQKPLGVELMDIDCFKEYNDTYGHLAGDICIEAVANVLKDVENERVFCARYGGDEFMIVYSDMAVDEICSVAKTIQSRVRALEIQHDHPDGCERGAKVTVSQGIFIRIPEEENREWDFNSMADTVLYEAKKDGKNRYRVATDFR